MAQYFRIISIWLLALCIVASGVTSAIARSAAHGQYMVTICNEFGVVQITLDAQGNPVLPMHPCPDCVVALAGVLPDQVLLPLRTLRWAAFVPSVPSSPVFAIRPMPARARGPPDRS
jgi:hypothetical protein